MNEEGKRTYEYATSAIPRSSHASRTSLTSSSSAKRESSTSTAATGWTCAPGISEVSGTGMEGTYGVGFSESGSGDLGETDVLFKEG